MRGELASVFKQVTPDSRDFGHTRAELRSMLRGVKLPDETVKLIAERYAALVADAMVAVRSSATAEDSASTSFAGMHETFINVHGLPQLLSRIVDCWVSLYGERVVAYRKTRRVRDEPTIAVVVQRMVDLRRSGVLFTVDPSTGDPSRMVIEGAFGLGEVVAGGQVQPDTYVIAKERMGLIEARVDHKTHQIVRGLEGDVRVELSGEEAERRVLSEDELLELAKLGRRVEEHCGSPQDIEWADEGRGFVLVQSRPITTLKARESADHAVRVAGWGLAGPRLGPRASAAQPERGRLPAARRNPPRVDDVSGLGAGAAKGGGL